MLKRRGPKTHPSETAFKNLSQELNLLLTLVQYHLFKGQL